MARETPKAKAEGAKTTQKEEVVVEKAILKAKVAEAKATERAKDQEKEQEKVSSGTRNHPHHSRAYATGAAVRATKAPTVGKRRMPTATAFHLIREKVEEERTRSNKLMVPQTTLRTTTITTVGTISTNSSNHRPPGLNRPIRVED